MTSKSQTKTLPHNWWAVPAEELAERLDVDPEHGPDPGRVDALRTRYGRNELEGIEPASTWELLWESVTSPMMLLLLAVAGISLALGQYREAAVMAFVVLTYVGVELINKRRTDRTLARLRELQAPHTRVLRGGERREVRIDEVVVGDVVPLGPGTRVPADGRLLSTAGLLVNEAPLTGESAPQPKDAAAAVEPDGPLAERPTAVFAGTTVLDGEGRALIAAVGSQTELGRIAVRSAEAADERTPLQQEMDDLARTLAFIAVGVSLLIPLAGLLRGFDLERMVLTWLSLTFLMVPGQPPIIITMALALAALELARRDVIVRRLAGAETLGSVDVILADKTGTITENEMALAAAVLGDGTLVRPGEGDAWRGFLRRALPAVPQHPNDPTDQAIRAAAEELEPPVDAGPGGLVDEEGFARGEGLRRRIYRRDGERRVYLAGSPEAVVEKTTRWAVGEETQAWTGEQRDALRARVEELAAEGRRITAYACGAPDGLTFAGCAVLQDPIREGVEEAIDELAQAGVRTVMVTGDRPATARFVAQEIGLDASSLLTGPELDNVDLEEAVRRVDVFARTSPEQKLELVEALQAQGQTVAVTGDGVNDAARRAPGHRHGRHRHRRSPRGGRPDPHRRRPGPPARGGGHRPQGVRQLP
jgi:Ca2+-transporting ATPase